LTSCSTTITDWEKKKLKWTELPKEVQAAMINAIGPINTEDGGKMYGEVKPEITSLEKGINVKYKWMNSGGGTGYHRLIINGKNYDLDSPGRGNEQNEPYVLYEHKLYYLTTLNVDEDEKLETADFGFFDFKNEY
jgi:hypothetical protein